MDQRPPVLLFFSGLGADSNLFVFQKLAFPSLVAADWLVPEKNESLDHYLERWLDQLEENGEFSRSGKVIVGGASFGGLLAQKVARKLNSRHCILFGSIKQRSEVPKRLRWLKPLHYLASRWIIQFWQWVVRVFVFVFGKLLRRQARSVLTQFGKLDSRLIQWSLRQLYVSLDELPLEAPQQEPSTLANPEQKTGVTLHQIHGVHDRVFPSRLIGERKDTRLHLLENAGHLLTLFESGEVNCIIRDVIDGDAQQSKPDETIIQ